MSDTASYQTTPDQLAKNALEKLRALCKGNGVKADSIVMLRHSIALHTLHAGTYLELRPITGEQETPGKIVVGQMVGSREEASKQIEAAMSNAARDSAIKAQIAQIILARPDRGFGLNGTQIPLDFLKRDYTWHDGCTACRGSGQAPCLKCRGQRVEPCIKCSGRGLMLCPTCRGAGLLQGVKCHKCFGHRYVPCDVCRKSGMMPCRTCHGQGTGKCATCGGQGWRSHVMSLTAGALTYFEYDGKSIPQGASHMIETSAPSLVKQKKVKLEARIADDKENAIGANYEVTFPYGEAVFTVGKKDFTAGVFGYQGDFVTMPHILDKLIQKGVEELQDAAGNVGSVAEKIKSATRYRLIAQAFLYAAKTTPDKAVQALLKKFDAGLSEGMAERVITLAEQSVMRISKKPRLHGMIAGIGLTSLVIAIYYLAPVRSSIAAHFPDPRFDGVLDLLPILLGGLLTPMLVKMMAAGSVRTALGHLLPEGEKKSLMPKPGRAGMIGYVAAGVLSLIMMQFCVMNGLPAPWWFVKLHMLLGF